MTLGSLSADVWSCVPVLLVVWPKTSSTGACRQFGLARSWCRGRELQVSSCTLIKLAVGIFWCSSILGSVFSPQCHRPKSCCYSVAESCLPFCNPVNCTVPGFHVLHHLPEFAQTSVHCSVMPSNHLSLCHPLLLLPSIFPIIRVFSYQLALHTRWPMCWSFSLSISPSNEYSGLISFRIH